MKKTAYYFLFLVLLCSCQPRQTIAPHTVFVSIAPLKSLVQAITEQDFPIEVLVPAGASPETFEPTPRQYIALNEAQWIFHTGLIDFEQSLLTKIDHQEKLTNLHEGIELLAGSCSHHHSHKHPHHHGIDPHIWTSPRALQQMAATMYATIHAAYPDSVRYTANYERLQAQLIALDQRTEEQIAESGIRSFVVYHPALTYYARDYGLTQEAIEQEGKEPSARQLAALIRKARSEGVRTILYQRQFPRSSVETLAADIDAQAIEFDPLAEDIVSQIDSITSWITRR